MKYSIVIVTYKDSDAMLRCLRSLCDSLPADAPRNAEIILVDNSPDQMSKLITNDFLTEIQMKYLNVWMIWNEGENKGFSAAVNQGVARAVGKNIVLLNPDCMVYADWLDRMDAHLDVSGVGAVGPLSNYVAGAQFYGTHMTIVGADWAETANMASLRIRNKGINTKLLIGFCLMVRRKVWHEVGGLDESLFLGCDDLDFSLRLRDLGYTLDIAADVFVYHEGHTSMRQDMGQSQTFIKQSENAFMKKLEAKYGVGQIPSSTELWGNEILPTHTTKPMTLSVSMIVKNEEDNLKELLPQLWFADEIIIVNTSPNFPVKFGGDIEWDENLVETWKRGEDCQFPTLRTTSPKKAPIIKIFNFDWNDNFSDARNESLSYCQGDYVLWLDADDRVSELSGKQIRAAFDKPGPMTAAKGCFFILQLADKSQEGASIHDQPRIFPRIPGVEWEGRVHEGFGKSAVTLGLIAAKAAIVIEHTGYMNKELLHKKARRNLELLAMDRDSIEKMYQIGKCYAALGEFPKARETWTQYLNSPDVLNIGLSSKEAGDIMIDEVRYLVALSYYQEFREPTREMDEFLHMNKKADALYLRAERCLWEGQYQSAYELYQQYVGLGAFGDYMGTDRLQFTPDAKVKIMAINAARIPSEDDAAEVVATHG